MASGIVRTAAAAAAVIFTAVLTREAGGGRKLAAALVCNQPGDMTAGQLRSRSVALQRHLKSSPGDVLAASLLNDVDTEIIRRAR